MASITHASVIYYSVITYANGHIGEYHVQGTWDERGEVIWSIDSEEGATNYAGTAVWGAITDQVTRQEQLYAIDDGSRYNSAAIYADGNIILLGDDSRSFDNDAEILAFIGRVWNQIL